VFDYTAPTTVIASSKNELRKFDKGDLFFVYPNPVKDVLHIQISDGKVSLINQSGEILLTKVIRGSDAINVINLPSGLYYLKTCKQGK
jgi:hypothetical protein